MTQTTLKKSYKFEGKGLHTGRYSYVCLKPGPVDSGIVFLRSDLGIAIPAIARNVSSTARSTTLKCGRASVRTVEHVLSALTGMGVDNAIVEINGREMPILDGSAKPYVEAIAADGLKELNAERRWVELKKDVLVRNARTGGWIKIEPADRFSIDLTIDFKSSVIGRQTVSWSLEDDYLTEIAPCRTFCFLREIQLLALLGLVKGGDVENAIIVVDKPVSERRIAIMAKLFSQPRLSVTPEGYLSNLQLRFPNECARHKMLDIIGDLRLCGGFPKVRVTAYKPGHALNTQAAEQIRKSI